MKKIGIISDTHGVLRKEVLEALKESDLIIHAGDIGKLEVIEELKKVASVYAVRGNNDKEKWAEIFPFTQVVQVNSIYIYVIHDIKNLDIDPKAAGMQIVVSGHTHKTEEKIQDEILYINPGGSGVRRFNLALTLAILEISDNKIEVKFIDLQEAK